MFSLTELAPFNQHQCRFKLLKPWWEVFMDYFVVLMLLISVLACTEHLSRDKVVCLPLLPLESAGDQASAGVNGVSTPSSEPPIKAEDSNFQSGAKGRQTHLAFQQYVYISQVCYHEALPLCARFFPYMALLQSLVLVASGSFWLHFPYTSSRIEHFLAILAKCCESPWTSQAVSNAAQQGKKTSQGQTLPQIPSALRPETTSRRSSSIDSGASCPVFSRSDIAPVHHFHCPPTSADPVSSTSFSTHIYVPSSETALPVHCPRQEISLDKSDEEQARALFEKVGKFRSHCESSDVIYKVYLAQTILKLVFVSLVMSYTIPLLNSFSFAHNCEPAVQAMVGFSAFECVHVLSSLTHKLLVAYLVFLVLYGLINFYTLTWILYSPLCWYSFLGTSPLSDIPDLRNDLAFLLHMLDQYDHLLALRLAIFLCPAGENRLPGEDLESAWGEERLRAMISMDLEGYSKLQLVALRRLPPAVFALNRLHILQLKHIEEAKFTAHVVNMSFLRELHLHHCKAEVEPSALCILQNRLEVLHLIFNQASEIPSWVFSLCNLHELHLSARMDTESAVGRSWSLGSLRQLHHLRVLVIRGALHRIPAELCEVAGSLTRLEIHNEANRLVVFTGLKQMVNLTELLLQDCQLDCLPSALQCLTNLRTIDLQHNNLMALREIVRLAHLPNLSCLKVAFNQVLLLPVSVGLLQGLQILDLSNNQLQSLPPSLFKLQSLRRLLLGGNMLEKLPSEVKSLHLLRELDLSANRLRYLPYELFSDCLNLCILNVAHNSLNSIPKEIAALSRLYRLDLRDNSLKELPAELGCCSRLHRDGLLVEDSLFLSLPDHVRNCLRRSCLFSDFKAVDNSQAKRDSFPHFCPAEWNFSNAAESQI